MVAPSHSPQTAPSAGPRPDRIKALRSKRIGEAVLVGAAGLFALGILSVQLPSRWLGDGLVGAAAAVFWLLLAGLLATGCMYRGLVLRSRARRALVEPGEDVLKRDPRAPVVYLRSFADDAATHAPLDRFWTRIGYHSEEEELAAAFANVGPLVAVGAPGEVLPELGALRLYFPNDKWRSEVEGLVDRASFVVLRAGATPGLLLELKTVIDRVSPACLLLAVAAEDAYAAFATQANAQLRVPLPSTVSGDRLGSMRAFIMFGPDFVSKTLPLRKSWLHWSVRHPYLADLHEALRPAFAARGLDARAMPFPWWKVPVLVLLLIAMVAIQCR